MNRQKTLERAKAALREKTLWRAKEILQGNISSHGYDSEIFECYGQVLLQMGDTIEAGKYLFLSGFQNPEYHDAIERYLRRFHKTSATDLRANFPRAIRRMEPVKLPTVVIERLRERGLSEDQIRDATEEKKTGESSWDEKLIIGGCLSIFIILLVIIVIGLRTIASWLL